MARSINKKTLKGKLMINKIRKEGMFKEALRELDSMNVNEGIMSRLAGRHPEMHRAVFESHDEIDRNYADDSVGLGTFEKVITKWKRLMMAVISADLHRGAE